MSEEKNTGLSWGIGCLIAIIAIPIILAVIGLLAAIAIPSFMRARVAAQARAHERAARGILSQIHGDQTNAMPEQRAVLFEIEAVPTATFLDMVARSPRLTEAEKTLVQQNLSPNAYSNCRLVKYQQAGALCMDLDQFSPRKETGKDPAGQPISGGGAGSLIIFKYTNEQWTIHSTREYD